MIDPIWTRVEPGITAEQADTIHDLAAALGLSEDALAELCHAETGWPRPLDCGREDAERLIGSLRALRTLRDAYNSS